MGVTGVQLTERDKKILRHLRRYRITTSEVLKHLFFRDTSREAVKKVVGRLQGSYLQARPLYGKRLYYQLTASTARQLGEPEEVSKPLGRQSLPTAYGVLAFCCLGTVRRKRFTRVEFKERFSHLIDAGLAFNDYYLGTHDGTTRLTRIVVDLGGDTQRLVRKLKGMVRKQRDNPSFVELFDEDGYAFAVVTSEDEKRHAIHEALLRRPLGVWVHVGVVPDLGHLLEGSNLS